MKSLQTVDDFFTETDEERFFKVHGVGNNPVDASVPEVYRHTIEPDSPTAEEVMFSRLVVKGELPGTALRKAFNYGDDAYASREGFNSAARRLMKRPRVAKQIYDLRKKLADLAGEDIASIISDINDDRQLARDLGQPAAAIAATKLKANLLGLERANSTTTNITISLSPDQKSALLNRIRNVSDIEDAEVVNE